MHHAHHAALEQFSDVIRKTTRWNYHHICGFDDNAILLACTKTRNTGTPRNTKTSNKLVNLFNVLWLLKTVKKPNNIGACNWKKLNISLKVTASFYKSGILRLRLREDAFLFDSLFVPFFNSVPLISLFPYFFLSLFFISSIFLSVFLFTFFLYF